jgi:hypothetical protein
MGELLIAEPTTAFDCELSRRVDVYIDALDKVRAWPDSAAKQACMGVLDKQLRKLLKAMPV